MDKILLGGLLLLTFVCFLEAKTGKENVEESISYRIALQQNKLNKTVNGKKLSLKREVKIRLTIHAFCQVTECNFLQQSAECQIPNDYQNALKFYKAKEKPHKYEASIKQIEKWIEKNVKLAFRKIIIESQRDPEQLEQWCMCLGDVVHLRQCDVISHISGLRYNFKTELDKLRKQVKSQKHELTNSTKVLTAQNQELSLEANTLRDQNQELNASVNALLSEYKKLREDFLVHIAEINPFMKALADQNKKLCTSVESLETSVNTLSSEKKQLTVNLNKMAAEVEELKHVESGEITCGARTTWHAGRFAEVQKFSKPFVHPPVVFISNKWVNFTPTTGRKVTLSVYIFTVSTTDFSVVCGHLMNDDGFYQTANWIAFPH